MKLDKLFLLGVFLLGMISFVSAHAGNDYYDHHNMMGSWGMNSFWGVLMWIIFTLVIIVLVLIIILIGNKIKER